MVGVGFCVIIVHHWTVDICYFALLCHFRDALNLT
jgi:hypothetical protein